MYLISGPDQTRPADFVKELRNSNFKEALVRFLIVNWQSKEIVPFLGNKTVLLNFDQCYEYKVYNETVIFSRNDIYTIEAHEEADTKIVFHACNIPSEANIMIKCSDTDILIIMLANMNKITNNSRVWIETGILNRQRIIDVSALYEKHGKLFCKSLAGFHAMTGCDFNPAFYRKGKQRPLQLLQNCEQFQSAFAELGSENYNLPDDLNVFQTIEKFVCALYTLKSLDSVNNARFVLFLKTYQVYDINEPFKKKLQNVDASSMPPCAAELKQHVLRSMYIARLWRHAYKKIPTTLTPENCGWLKIDEKYEFQWFDGPQLPPSVKDVIIDSEQSEADVEEIESEDDIDCDSEEDIEYDESDVNSEIE